MNPSLKEIRWWRIILGGVLIAAASFATTALVITSYAFSLAMEARGAPDQQQIQEFASHVGPSWTPIIAVVLTFLGAIRVTRGMKDEAVTHGVILGACAVLTGTVIGTLIGRGFSLHSVLLGILPVAAGWGGAVLSRRKSMRDVQDRPSTSAT